MCWVIRKSKRWSTMGKILKPNGRWWSTMIDWRGCCCCPNNHCDYKVMFKRPNKLKFDRYKRWILYGAGGFYLKCIARKHAACISETEGDVFYYGAQLREAKIQSGVDVNVVSEAIRIDPSIKPSAIQGNVVLFAIRSRKPWNDFRKAVKKWLTERTYQRKNTSKSRFCCPMVTFSVQLMNTKKTVMNLIHSSYIFWMKIDNGSSKPPSWKLQKKWIPMVIIFSERNTVARTVRRTVAVT